MPWASYLAHRQTIAELLDPRFYTIEWLDQGIASGASTVFGDGRACIVTEIKTYPTGAKEVHGLVAAGELPAILELIEQAEVWGREQGAIVAGISSREGWGRLLHDRGYRPYQTEIRKELA